MYLKQVGLFSNLGDHCPGGAMSFTPCRGNINPCEHIGGCASDSSLTCQVDECGSCQAMFYDQNWMPAMCQGIIITRFTRITYIVYKLITLNIASNRLLKITFVGMQWRMIQDHLSHCISWVRVLLFKHYFLCLVHFSILFRIQIRWIRHILSFVLDPIGNKFARVARIDGSS